MQAIRNTECNLVFMFLAEGQPSLCVGGDWRFTAGRERSGRLKLTDRGTWFGVLFTDVTGWFSCRWVSNWSKDKTMRGLVEN